MIFKPKVATIILLLIISIFTLLKTNKI